MKFAAILLASLATVTAVGAIPTPRVYDASVASARFDEDDLFVRYSDLVAYLDARGSTSSTQRNSNSNPPPYSQGSRSGPGGDVGSTGSLPAYRHGNSDPPPRYGGSQNHTPGFLTNALHPPTSYASNTKTPTGHNRRELFARGGNAMSKIGPIKTKPETTTAG